MKTNTQIVTVYCASYRDSLVAHNFIIQASRVKVCTLEGWVCGSSGVFDNRYFSRYHQKSRTVTPFQNEFHHHQKLELDQLPHVQEHAPISTKQTQCITTKNYQMHNVVCQSTSYSKLSLEFEHVYYLCNSTTSLIISSLHINDHNPKLYMYPIREQQTWKSVYSLIVPSIQPWGDTWTSCSPPDNPE